MRRVAFWALVAALAALGSFLGFLSSDSRPWWANIIALLLVVIGCVLCFVFSDDIVSGNRARIGLASSPFVLAVIIALVGILLADGDSGGELLTGSTDPAAPGTPQASVTEQSTPTTNAGEGPVVEPTVADAIASLNVSTLDVAELASGGRRYSIRVANSGTGGLVVDEVLLGFHHGPAVGGGSQSRYNVESVAVVTDEREGETAIDIEQTLGDGDSSAALPTRAIEYNGTGAHDRLIQALISLDLPPGSSESFEVDVPAAFDVVSYEVPGGEPGTALIEQEADDLPAESRVIEWFDLVNTYGFESEEAWYSATVRGVTLDGEERVCDQEISSALDTGRTSDRPPPVRPLGGEGVDLGSLCRDGLPS